MISYESSCMILLLNDTVRPNTCSAASFTGLLTWCFIASSISSSIAEICDFNPLISSSIILRSATSFWRIVSACWASITVCCIATRELRQRFRLDLVFASCLLSSALRSLGGIIDKRSSNGLFSDILSLSLIKSYDLK